MEERRLDSMSHRPAAGRMNGRGAGRDDAQGMGGVCGDSGGVRASSSTLSNSSSVGGGDGRCMSGPDRSERLGRRPWKAAVSGFVGEPRAWQASQRRRGRGRGVGTSDGPDGVRRGRELMRRGEINAEPPLSHGEEDDDDEGGEYSSRATAAILLGVKSAGAGSCGGVGGGGGGGDRPSPRDREPYRGGRGEMFQEVNRRVSPPVSPRGNITNSGGGGGSGGSGLRKRDRSSLRQNGGGGGGGGSGASSSRSGGSCDGGGGDALVQGFPTDIAASASWCGRREGGMLRPLDGDQVGGSSPERGRRRQSVRRRVDAGGGDRRLEGGY